MNIFKKLTINKPNYLDIAFFAALLVFCYFCFNQVDILHTGGSSFAYLNGHIKDFYEVNKEIVGGNSYLPSTFILFAIWNLPIKLLGIVTQVTMSVGPVIFWYKLLPTLFLAGSAYFFYKIGRIIGLNKKNSKLMTIIWITTPLLFYSQFIWGQYDIFTTFFMLVGLYYYLQRKTWLFILFFSISFTFKYFPVLVFIPLLLLIEKNPLKLIGYFVLSMIPVAIEALFYINSAAFNSGVLGFSPLREIYMAAISIHLEFVKISLFIVIWFIICGICYFIALSENPNNFYQVSLYCCLAVSCILFTFVLWYPHWLLFMTPFLAITTFMSKKIEKFLLLDFILMLAFVGFIVIAYPGNGDQNTMILGILGNLNPNLLDPEKVFTMSQLFTLGSNQEGFFRNIYYTLFSAILILNILFKFPNKENLWECDKKLVAVKQYWNYARLRFFGGIASFVIPAFIAYSFTLIGFSPTLFALNDNNAPTLISPARGTVVAGNSVTYFWEPVPGTVTYALHIATSPDCITGSKFNNVVGNVTSYIDSNYPNNGTKYYWEVLSWNGASWGSPSKLRSFINGP